jgi:hypothetical protein
MFPDDENLNGKHDKFGSGMKNVCGFERSSPSYFAPISYTLELRRI